METTPNHLNKPALHFRNAGEEDLPAIVSLLNTTYRGEQSRKGWTTEADLIAGDIRTTPENLRQVMQEPGSIFLTFRDDTDRILSCVNLRKQGDRLYLGMFSVWPELQGAGLGGQMLEAAERYARSVGCRTIYMWVISLRYELIAWYKRKGYRETGEKVPFKEDFTGRHLRPLEFLVLEKKLD